LEALQGFFKNIYFLFHFHVKKLGKFNQNSFAELVEITQENKNFPKKIQIALSKNGEVSPEKNSMESIVFLAIFV
jgi:hypothetical protein